MRVFDNYPPLFASKTGDHASMILAIQRLSLPDLEGRMYPDAFVQGDGTLEGFRLRECGDLLLGGVRTRVRRDLAVQTQELYRRLFSTCRGWNLVRIWNVIPAVNKVVRGVENYRAFNIGRASAYQERFGDQMRQNTCAATAVGGFGPYLDISFIAVRGQPVHLENPRQIPPPDYPKEYGLRPPMFSRATKCDIEDMHMGFVSGTSAITGYESRGVTLPEQCAVTEENLHIMEQQLRDNCIDRGIHRYVNVFIRRQADEDFILDHLSRHWTRPSDTVRIYRAEICRPELLLEVEFMAMCLNE